MKVAIIGAGPAGLAIAHQFSKNNIEVDIYDNSENVGGFAKTIKVFDQNVEIGPHFLNAAQFPAVKEIITDVLDAEFTVYERKTYIVTLNKLFLYPATIQDIFRKLNLFQLGRAAAALIKQFSFPVKLNGTAERYVKRMLGNYLFEHFFQNFCKKLWSLNAGQLSDDFVKSLIGVSGKSSVLALLWHKIKTAVAQKAEQPQYIYPVGGFSTLWDAMKNRIVEQGGRFYLSASIEKLICEDDDQRIARINLKNGTVREYDFFISTIPILPLIAYLSPSVGHPIKPIGTIRFRSDLLLYLHVTYETAVSGQTFYVYSEDIKITRVTNFNEFDVQKQNNSTAIVLLEFWCNEGDVLWLAQEDELLQIAASELEKTPIFTGLKILDKTVKKIKNAFQIPDLSLADNQGKLFGQLAQYKNLAITGRNASISFNYGMENAIDDAIKLADKLMPYLNRDVAIENIPPSNLNLS
jgi:protoporphyrinogen oxidase